MLPDGRLASCSYDANINLWNLASGQLEATLTGHAGAVTALAVLPDGRLVSCSHDVTIKLWNLASGRLEASLEGHTGAVTALAVLPDGRLVSGSADQTVALGVIAPGVGIKWINTFVADVSIVCVAIAADRRTIVAGDNAGRMHFLRFEEA